MYRMWKRLERVKVKKKVAKAKENENLERF